jgi:hypothetical protein
MARKRYTPEQIVGILRQVEVLVANEKPTVRHAGKPGAGPALLVD